MFFEKKKKYIAPEMDVIEADFQGSLLCESDPPIVDIIEDGSESSAED